jgi:hypothetical protein
LPLRAPVSLPALKAANQTLNYKNFDSLAPAHFGLSP